MTTVWPGTPLKWATVVALPFVNVTSDSTSVGGPEGAGGVGSSVAVGVGSGGDVGGGAWVVVEPGLVGAGAGPDFTGVDG